jgi:exodeoxyribonuclease VII small subunit
MSTRKPAAPPESYDDAVQELESIISKLEAGQMPLEQMLGNYRRGHELLKRCEEQLRVLQQQITVIDSQQNDTQTGNADE